MILTAIAILWSQFLMGQEKDELEMLRLLSNKEVPYDGNFVLCLDGTKFYEVRFKDGKKEGIEKRWHVNGQVASEAYYKKGKKTGLVKHWFSNGVLEEIGFWKKGKRKGSFIEFYTNGSLKSMMSYKNNLLNGEFLVLFNNQKTCTEGKYKLGKRDELWTEWWSNGQKRSEAQWKDGDLINTKYWSTTGEELRVISANEDSLNSLIADNESRIGIKIEKTVKKYLEGLKTDDMGSYQNLITIKAEIDQSGKMQNLIIDGCQCVIDIDIALYQELTSLNFESETLQQGPLFLKKTILFHIL